MKVFKEMKWDALMTGALYVILGLASLVIPETMEKTIGYLMGSVLIVAGAVSMISYLLRDAYQNYYHNDFFHGLVAIGAGILVLVKVEIIVALIPFLLGVMILVSGCSKLQDVIDMKRTEYGNWVVMLAFAAGNLLVGILLMVCPIESAHLLFRLLGLGLIFSGITDCVITIYFARKIRAYLDGLREADGAPEELRGAGTKAKARRKEALPGQRNSGVKSDPGTGPNRGAGWNAGAAQPPTAGPNAAESNAGAAQPPVAGTNAAGLNAGANQPSVAGPNAAAGLNPGAAQPPVAGTNTAGLNAGANQSPVAGSNAAAGLNPGTAQNPGAEPNSK